MRIKNHDHRDSNLFACSGDIQTLNVDLSTLRQALRRLDAQRTTLRQSRSTAAGAISATYQAVEEAHSTTKDLERRLAVDINVLEDAELLKAQLLTMNRNVEREVQFLFALPTS